MSDDLENSLRSITAEMPEARPLSLSEKQELLARLGPRRARDILNAQKDISKSRLPFIFNNLDPQDLVDLLANDMRTMVEEAIKATSRRTKTKK